MHILVADDDRMSLKLITFLLESSGYSVSTAANGQEALAVFALGEIDLIVLDVDLPIVNGLEVCREVRMYSNIPIIFVSGHREVHERVAGLQIGGDDYLAKPFEPLELLARIEALLRRRERDNVVPLGRIRQGDLILNPVDHQVVFEDGHTAELTPVEFRLLYYLMKHAGQILSNEQIIQRVWHAEGGANLVAVYIRRVRAKIEQNSQRPAYISTIPGLGYRFEAHSKAELLMV